MTNKEGKRRLRVNYVNLDPGDQMEAAKRLQEEGWRSLRQAERDLKAAAYPESIRASRLAMAKFAQAIMAACLGKYSSTHRFKPDDCISALRRIDAVGPTVPIPMVTRACAWAFLLANMWSLAHKLMTHGIEELSLSPKDLFEKPQAERACRDAQDCKLAVTWLISKG